MIVEQLAFVCWSKELADGQGAMVRSEAAGLLERAVTAGAGFASSAGGERLFDPVEVQNHLAWLAASGNDSAWADRMAATNAAIMTGARAGSIGPERDYCVDIRRDFDLARFEPATRLRLRAPMPLDSEYHEVVSVIPEPGKPTTVSAGRLETQFVLDEERRVRIGAAVRLRAFTLGPDPGAGRLDETSAQAHLRPSDGLIQVTPRIAETAAWLAGQLGPVEAVARFIAFLEENSRFYLVRYDELPPDAAPESLLDNGAGDCLLCAATLISLCRARGIPARLVTGHFLNELSPTNHNWAEIWIDDMGWRPVDVVHLDGGNPASGAGQDWTRDFVARRDFRLANQRLPLAFTGPMSVRLRSPWQAFQTAIPGGVAISYFDVATGDRLYRDEITVKRLN